MPSNNFYSVRPPGPNTVIYGDTDDSLRGVISRISDGIGVIKRFFSRSDYLPDRYVLLDNLRKYIESEREVVSCRIVNRPDTIATDIVVNFIDGRYRTFTISDYEIDILRGSSDFIQKEFEW